VRRLGVWLILLTTVPAYPQARFEVSSVRPSPPGVTVRDARHNLRGDRFEAKAMTVGDILDMLGDYRLFRVVGGPAWMRTDRYDIEAKADRALTGADQEAAVMALLAERFKLESHKETREVPGFVLRIPKMPARLKQAADADSYAPVFIDAQGDVVFNKYSMPGFTNYLSQILSGPVVDETGLSGMYSFVLPVSEVSLRNYFGDRLREAAEAFGFRIEEKKILLEVTVVDRCERPSEN
jgi:uncharacterized protein (TIGR03435 family)